MSQLRPGEARRVLNDRPHAGDVAPEASELRDVGAAFGALARDVRVGSLRVRLEGLDERLAGRIDLGYAGFVGEAGGTADSTTRVVRSQRPRYLHLTRGGGASEEARMAARSDERGLELWSYFFASAFDREGREARLLLCEAQDLDVEQAIENHLRFLVATRALAAGGFVLHSAGIAQEGRAFLFFGPSGAGKSTTAANAPAGSELLGDDLVLVERSSDGTWRACGVPFRGTFSRGANAGSCAPLALACRLFQSDEEKLETVPRSIQVAEVLGEMPFLADDAQLRDHAAERAEQFVREVPVRRLHLRRGASYWRVVAAFS